LTQPGLQRVVVVVPSLETLPGALHEWEDPRVAVVVAPFGEAEAWERAARGIDSPWEDRVSID